ncbi:hypothetical protein FIBSPDRAFT_749459, partial [Athelia psychrophila]
KAYVRDASTLRRHAESKFAGKYRKWAKDSNFISMLPSDVEDRKIKAKITQRSLDEHLVHEKLSERVLSYTDQRFRSAAIEWLITTDQPIAALEHPKFKDMIDIASRATNGVKIPNRKATRLAIIRMFKSQLSNLKKRLNVSLNPSQTILLY